VRVKAQKRRFLALEGRRRVRMRREWEEEGERSFDKKIQSIWIDATIAEYFTSHKLYRDARSMRDRSVP
jgi:hypothetical protein